VIFQYTNKTTLEASVAASVLHDCNNLARCESTQKVETTRLTPAGPKIRSHLQLSKDVMNIIVSQPSGKLDYFMYLVDR
jgi:hypothetical protein